VLLLVLLLWAVCDGLAPTSRSSSSSSSRTSAAPTSTVSPTLSSTITSSSSTPPPIARPGQWYVLRDDAPADASSWNMSRLFPTHQNIDIVTISLRPTMLLLTRVDVSASLLWWRSMALDLPLRRRFPQNNSALATNPGTAHFFLWDPSNTTTLDPPRGDWVALAGILRESWTTLAPTYNQTWAPTREFGVYRYEHTFINPLPGNASYWLGLFLEQSHYGNANNTIYWLSSNAATSPFWYMDVHGNAITNTLLAAPQKNLTLAPTATVYYANVSVYTLGATIYGDCTAQPLATDSYFSILPDPALTSVITLASTPSSSTPPPPAVQPTATVPSASTPPPPSPAAQPSSTPPPPPPSPAVQPSSTPPPPPSTAARPSSTPPPAASWNVGTPSQPVTAWPASTIRPSPVNESGTNTTSRVSTLPDSGTTSSFIISPTPVTPSSVLDWVQQQAGPVTPLIAGIAIVSILLVIVTVALMVCVIRRWRQRKQEGISAIIMQPLSTELPPGEKPDPGDYGDGTDEDDGDAMIGDMDEDAGQVELDASESATRPSGVIVIGKSTSTTMPPKL